MQKVILSANFDSFVSIMENIRSMINSLKAYIYGLEVQTGIRSTEENLEDIKKKCVGAHHKVVKELKDVQVCEKEA